MERSNEIKELLKYLLGETEDVVDKCQYSRDISKIIVASEGVVAKAKLIEGYLSELAELAELAELGSIKQ